MSIDDRVRTPAGTPAGGRFTSSSRDESPVALAVEFARDEAEQVDWALGRHQGAIAAEAVSGNRDRSLVWSPEDRAYWIANQSARAALVAMRQHMGDNDFTTRAFNLDEVQAMHDALAFQRLASAARPSNPRALEAARFRLDTACPLVPEPDLNGDDT